jgi:hypothetical protein
MAVIVEHPLRQDFQKDGTSQVDSEAKSTALLWHYLRDVHISFGAHHLAHHMWHLRQLLHQFTCSSRWRTSTCCTTPLLECQGMPL